MEVDAGRREAERATSPNYARLLHCCYSPNKHSLIAISYARTFDDDCEDGARNKVNATLRFIA
jgi:hypothetical protein